MSQFPLEKVGKSQSCTRSLLLLTGLAVVVWCHREITQRERSRPTVVRWFGLRSNQLLPLLTARIGYPRAR